MDLSRQVLEANESHKDALDKYSLKLQAELNAVDKLIAAVEELPEEELQEDPGDKWCLHANGAFKPTGIIDLTQTLDSKSPFNADALKRNRYVEFTHPNPFSSSEKRYLEKAVVKENRRLAAIRAQERGENAFDAASCGSDFFLENIEGINWSSVARDVSVSNSPLGGRTSQECRIRWLGAQHPKINTESWSDDEERRLLDLIESKRESGLNWEEIPRLLGTNRTPVDCIKRLQAKNRSSFRWSSAQDEKLLNAVRNHGTSNWTLVASSVSPDVSANQCQIRYRRSLNPEIKKGKFSSEEDERLMEAIGLYGSDWVKIAQAVGGRTNAQCRDRYTIYLTGGIVKAPWNQEEDDRLREAVTKYGSSWDKVREEMGRVRSRTQYATRYKALTRGDGQGAITRSAEPTPALAASSSAPAALSEGGAAEPATSADSTSGLVPSKNIKSGKAVNSAPKGKGKGKETTGGRKRKAIRPPPESQTGMKEGPAFQEGAETSTADIDAPHMSGQQTVISPSKGKRGRKRKASNPDTGLETVDLDQRKPVKRPRPRPTRKPRDSQASAGAGAAVGGTSSIPAPPDATGSNTELLDEVRPASNHVRHGSFGAKSTNTQKADPASQTTMLFDLADLSDLTDLSGLEDESPPKKGKTKARPTKTVTNTPPASKRLHTSTPQLPARTMRTRSSMKDLAVSGQGDAEMATTSEAGGKS